MSLGKKPKRQPLPADSPKSQAELEALYGEVFTPERLGHVFVVTAYISPNCLVVRRRRDDLVGTLEVQQGPPQFYFNFSPQPAAE